MDQRSLWRRSQSLASPLLHAGVVAVAILALYGYWFAIADRYAIFLYGHRGATPFDEGTSSRYWMAGLVAAGLVFLGYALVTWAIACVQHSYAPPPWFKVWALAAIPLAVGLPLIVMCANHPTLPPNLAAATTATALLGLAGALRLASLAAQRSAALGWLLLDGVGLIPLPLLALAIERPAGGRVSQAAGYIGAALSVCFAVLWLGAMTLLRYRRRPAPSVVDLWLAGLSWSYLLLPAIHHLFFAPAAYRYISEAGNFFPHRPWLLAMSWLLSGAMAFGFTCWRRRLCECPSPDPHRC